MNLATAVVLTISALLLPGSVMAAPYGTGSYGEAIYNQGQVIQDNSNSSSSSSSQPSASSGCTQQKPHEIPDLFQISGKKAGVILYFSPVNDNRDRYFVSYGITPEAEGYGFEFSNDDNGVIGVDVLALNPAITYYFKVRAGNGCMPGDWSNTLSASAGQFIPTFRWASAAKHVLRPPTRAYTQPDTTEPLVPLREAPLPEKPAVPEPAPTPSPRSAPTQRPSQPAPSQPQESQSLWQKVTGFLTGWLR